MGTVREIKLCLLGDAGVGKSSIVHRFVYDAFKATMESTIGAAFLTKSIALDTVVYKYQIWDTAGQEKYRALAPMYYRGAAAAIIVYDITVESSFKAVKSWIRELKQYADQDIILAIAGNKCDLEDSREIQCKDAQDYADEHGAIFVETSAKTAVNIAAMFVELSKRIGNSDSQRTNAAARPSDTINPSKRLAVKTTSRPNSPTSRPSCCT